MLKSIFIFRTYCYILDENAPCVGLCYHNKEKCYSDGQCEEFDRGWPINAREFGPPCVGICQYFRENNMPNPGTVQNFFLI